MNKVEAPDADGRKTSSVLRQVLKQIFDVQLIARLTWTGISRDGEKNENNQYGPELFSMKEHRSVVKMLIGKFSVYV